MKSMTEPTVHELNLYRRYFDLVAAGRKSIEVRVRQVTPYPDFEALLDGEGPANVNPIASRDEQLANIRSIYPPEKEALGALAIKIELIES
jgi:ASC-1-like (ASCH) protein